MNTYRIVQNGINKFVIPQVTKIIFISGLLISFSDLFLFLLSWSLFPHLSAVETINFFLLQPIWY